MKQPKSGKNYKMLINGKWEKSKKTIEVVDPATQTAFATVPAADKKQAVKALKATKKGETAVKALDAWERANILEEAADLMEENRKLFVDTIVKESGKTVSEAGGEVHASIARLKYGAIEALSIKGEFMKGDNAPSHRKRLAVVTRVPIGTVLAITPFNYPLFTPVGKVAPAIAGGNAVVLKPATDTPLSALLLGKLLEEAGLPKAGLQVITGHGSEIGDVLSSSEEIDMISLTGSTATGSHIASVAGMKKLHLELGGKGAALVLADADLDLAAREVVKGALKFSGQRCDAISRVLVEEKIADKFVKMLVKEVKKWNQGDPKKKKTKIGPLINESALENVKSLVDDAVKKGAKVRLGGKTKELWFSPTVLDKASPKMRIYKEETFGPIVTVIRVKNFKEGMKVTNNTEYGLDNCVFTKDLYKALDAGMHMESGSVTINSSPTHGIANFPFGGEKKSGMGREGIWVSVEEMTELHTVTISLPG